MHHRYRRGLGARTSRAMVVVSASLAMRLVTRAIPLTTAHAISTDVGCRRPGTSTFTRVFDALRPRMTPGTDQCPTLMLAARGLPFGGLLRLHACSPDAEIDQDRRGNEH